MRFVNLLVVAGVYCRDHTHEEETVHVHQHHEGKEHHHDEEHHEEKERVYTGADFTPAAMKKQSLEDFKGLDTDGNESLTRDELVAYLTGATGAEDQHMTVEEATQEVEDFFKQADENNDKEINFDEYYAFVLQLFEKYKRESENQPVNLQDFDFGDFDDGDFDLGEDDDEL